MILHHHLPLLQRQMFVRCTRSSRALSMCVVPTRMPFGPWWTRSAHSVYKRSRRPALKLARLLLHHLRPTPLHQPNAEIPPSGGRLPPVRSCRRGGCSVPPHPQCRVGYCVDHCTSARCTRNRRPSVRPPPHQQTPTPQHPTTRNRASRVDAVHNPSPPGAAAPGPSASGRPPLVARAPPRLLPLLQTHRPSRILAADVVALSLCISSAP